MFRLYPAVSSICFLFLFASAIPGGSTQAAKVNTGVVNPDRSKPAAAFTIDCTPAQLKLSRGELKSFHVKITRRAGFTGTVTVAADKEKLKPMGFKLNSFSQTTTDSQISFELKVKNKAQPGSYRLQLVGQDESGKPISRSELVLLVQ